MRWQQTGRPSWQINAKNIPGKAFIAEEMPWGFMALEDFDKRRDYYKASTIVHEAFHQMMQIGEQGKVRYLIDIRGRLVVNTGKEVVKKVFGFWKRSKSSDQDGEEAGKNVVYRAYRNIPQEREAYKVSNLFESIVKEL